MRGEVCVGAASILSFAAMMLLIFANIGQINTTSLPRGIYLARVNTSGYTRALNVALNVPIQGLNTTNSSSPLGEGQGLRPNYYFGMYSYCAYFNESAGACGNHTMGHQYLPYNALVADMPANYTQVTFNYLSASKFHDEAYLGPASKAAYWLILLGLVCSFLALVLGFAKHTLTFLLSTTFAILAAALTMIGAAIWTVLINKSQDINALIAYPGDRVVAGAISAPLGLTVTVGPALWLMWAAFGCLLFSVAPYMVSCCTYRG